MRRLALVLMATHALLGCASSETTSASPAPRKPVPERWPLSAPDEGTFGGLADAPRTQTWLLGGDRAALTIPALTGREMGVVEHAHVGIAAEELLVRAEGPLADAMRPSIPLGWSVENIAEDIALAFPETLVAVGMEVRFATIYLRDAQDLVVSFELTTDPYNAPRGGCVAFARDIAASAVIGSAGPTTGARVVTVLGLDMDVPEGFDSTYAGNFDFADFYMTRVRSAAASTPATLRMGDAREPFEHPETPTLTRTLLGEEVAFYDATNANVHRRRARIRFGGRDIDIAYESDDTLLFDAMDAAVMTLRTSRWVGPIDMRSFSCR